jgi:hypothetical protein
MTWQSETQLRDVPEGRALELTCIRCLYTWIEDPTQILIRVQHRDVYLDEVAKSLSCRRHGCTHTGVKLSLIRTDETSGFVGGMP